MKARLTFERGESITWESAAVAQAVAAKLPGIVRVEGCETIFLQAWSCVATFPGNMSPEMAQGFCHSSPARKHGHVSFSGAPENEEETEREEEGEGE